MRMQRAIGQRITRLLRLSRSVSTKKRCDIVLDKFCEPKFDLKTGDPSLAAYGVEAFVSKVNSTWEGPLRRELVPGYASFCKHIFIENFCGALAGAVRVTPENCHLLRTGYQSRQEGELPVLTRWFPRDAIDVPAAQYLDIILYSRDQIKAERAAMSDDVGGEQEEEAPWGIVSIKPTDSPSEPYMEPITMMRNALGREHGGSGVPLDREAYTAAVAYWADHAVVM